MFDLAGKTALVTGGGRGIGRGIVLALAGQGADVAVNYVTEATGAQQAVRDVIAAGRKAVAVQGDVSDKPQVDAMIAETVARLGHLDILVNNAGVVSMEPFLEITPASWDRVLAVNLRGTFLTAQAAARHMVSNKIKGRIINVASIASGQVGVGFPGTAHYTASKGGVVALTETMALELGPYGITANAVAPGIITTDMTKSMLASPEARRALLGRVPLGRFGSPEDVAALVAFLASDEAAYCTGAAFYVDGGWLAG